MRWALQPWSPWQLCACHVHRHSVPLKRCLTICNKQDIICCCAFCHTPRMLERQDQLSFSDMLTQIEICILLWLHSLHFWHFCWATRWRHSGSGRRCCTWRSHARKRPCRRAPASIQNYSPPCAPSFSTAWPPAGASSNSNSK